MLVTAVNHLTVNCSVSGPAAITFSFEHSIELIGRASRLDARYLEKKKKKDWTRIKECFIGSLTEWNEGVLTE